MKNTFGTSVAVTLFGESHGAMIGAVLDGMAPGVEVDEDFIARQLTLRRPYGAISTGRVEPDRFEIVSGVFEGRTTGTPLTILIPNTDTRSRDYAPLRALARPGHADYTAWAKYHGFADYRGGGHFSGRLTLPIVAAGVVAKKMIGYKVSAELVEVGGVSREDALASYREEALPDGGIEEKDTPGASEIWKDVLDEAIREKDSVGGIVECRVTNVPAGLGEPFFDSVESLISHAIFAIPGVRGIEFGDGFRAAAMKGSEHNDPFDTADSSGLKLHSSVHPSKNGAGGVNGGITNGNPIVFRTAFKPTSSIGKAQETFNFATGEICTLQIPGRHDACIALRTPVIVEAMTAIVLADLTRML